jgi:hypothetical protein
VSALTTTPLKVAPASAACVTVTSSTPAWTYGAWVEILAATGGVAQIAGIVVGVNSAGALAQYELEVGTGTAGNEVGIGLIRGFVPNGGNGGPSVYLLPAPIDNVPSGARISFRLRTNDTTESITFALLYYEGLDSDHKTDALLNAAPLASNNVVLTPNASAWANSTWVELISSLTDESALVAIAVSQPVASVDVEWDLSIGSAGNEVVITTLAASVQALNSGRIGTLTLPALLPVPAGSRIAIRMRKTGTNVTQHSAALLYYGDVNLLNPAVPDVDTLTVTGLRSTQARLRGRIDPNGFTMTGWLEWGIEGSPLALDNVTVTQAIGSGSTFVTYDALITGLLPETTYYYRAVGNDGTDDYEGEILSFTTLGEQAFIDGEVSFPLTYLEVTTRDAETRAFAEVDLNDAPDYHYGYKAPWVVRFLTIARGLSDRNGQIEHLSFGAVFSDTMRYFRGLLEDVVNKYLTNRPLAEWFIDDEDRRIEGLPRLAAVGYVNDYAPKPNLQFELKGADWLKKKFSRKRSAQQSWQPVITAEDFPDCAEETLGIAAPIIYGALGLTGADPVENVTITVNAQPSAAPTGFALSLQAGGRYAGVRRYYRVSQTIAGVESELTPTLTSVTTDTNKTIRLNWTPDGAATAINVYSSDKPEFGQFAYLQLAGSATQYDDDTTPPNQDANHLSGTDWALGLRLNLTYYVYAELAGGLFSRPGIATTSIMPLMREYILPATRDIDIDWDAHPDEVGGYRVIRKRSYYSNWDETFDRQIDVGTGVLTTNDDVITTSAVDLPIGEQIALAASGQVEAIPVGQLSVGSPPQVLNVLLIARHACARVGNIYIPVTIQNVDGEDETTYEPVAESDFGTSWFAPDHAGWLYAEKYVDINSRRYTIIATTVTPLPDKVLVDVDGVETDGDGEGELITSIVDQRLHFINNWVAPDTPYQSGIYLTAADTVFPHLPTLPLVDEISHATVKAQLAERLGTGDYEGASSALVGSSSPPRMP